MAYQQYNARWIAPVVPRERLYHHHSLIVNDGDIIDIVATDIAAQRYPNAEVTDLGKHLLIPGLINAHSHLAMSLLRGYADDRALMDWLNNYIWPIESKMMSSRFVEDGSRLALVEALLSGTTTVADMYFYPEDTAKVVEELGMRAQLSFPVLNFPSNWAPSCNYIEKGMVLYDRYKSHAKINIAFGPHSPYTVSDELFTNIKTITDELDSAAIHIHCHETAKEIDDALSKDGMRPLERLDRLQILGPQVQLIHMTQVIQKDIELIKRYAMSVVHCPESNMKLASGQCPVQRLLDEGINVALGTDGASSNNDLSMLGEMRSAALLAKITADNSCALSVNQVLEMATINGAKALGINDKVGSLEVGKQADFVAVNMSHIELQPIYNSLSQLVYNVQTQHIDGVWVAGQRLVDGGVVNNVDMLQLRQRVEQWQIAIGDFEQ